MFFLSGHPTNRENWSPIRFGVVLAIKYKECCMFFNFYSALSDPPKGKIIKSESPDFLIISEFQTVGVELTELHREICVNGRPMQEQEALRTRIFDSVQSKLDSSKKIKPMWVSIHFDPSVNCDKATTEAISHRIFSIVEGLDLLEGEYREFRSIDDDNLPECVEFLCVTGLSDNCINTVSINSAGFVPSLKISDIQKCLNSKEKKLERYLHKSDSVWLVVVISCGFMTTEFSGIEINDHDEVFSNFDRVFVFSASTRRVHEVRNIVSL